MSTKTKQTSEKAYERLQAAKVVEQDLLREQAEMPQKMKDAAREVAEGFETGQVFTESKAAAEIRRRREELPTLVWSASLARYRREIEYYELRAEEEKSEQYRASEKLEKLHEKIEAMQEPIRDLEDEMHYHNNRNKDHRQTLRRLNRERGSLEARGPGNAA